MAESTILVLNYRFEGPKHLTKFLIVDDSTKLNLFIYNFIKIMVINFQQRWWHFLLVWQERFFDKILLFSSDAPYSLIKRLPINL